MRNDFSVIILAAGQSSRMGKDKARLIWRNQPMWLWLKKLAVSLGSNDILISHPEFGQADHKPGFGPLSGLHTLLPQCQNKRVLILPVDMPLLSKDLLLTLLKEDESAHFESSALPCLIKHDPSIHAYIANQLCDDGQRSVKALLSFCKAKPIHCPTPELLANANTPDEWQTLFRKSS